MNQTANPAQESRPWYQHRMMLLVVGIPLLSVVVSFTFLAIAIHTFDGVVVDDYYKQGKEINRILQRDEMAKTLDLKADITLSSGIASVVLSSTKNLTWPSTLTLGVLHPTQNGRDIKVVLQAAPLDDNDINKQEVLSKQRYVSPLSEFKPGDWILQLETPTWRLNHRSSLTQNTSVLIRP